MRRIGSGVVSWVVVAAVTAMLSPVSMAFASVNDDQVTSQKLKEADGTSGQNANSGSGVKTAHIQDGAVTASKLGLVCPTGNYLQYVVGSGWVCSAGTAGPVGPQGPIGLTGPQGLTGAIGLQGTSGPIGATGEQGPVGVAGATGPVGPTPHYANVTVVAKSGGDYVTPWDAFTDINTWCGTPTEYNKCLIKIMPGIYDIPEGGLFRPASNVDIEGSGRETTKLRVNAYYWQVNNSETRSLTYETQGSALTVTYGSPKFTNVNFVIVGDGGKKGITILEANPIFENIEIIFKASGGTSNPNGDTNHGIYQDYGNSIFNNVNIVIESHDFVRMFYGVEGHASNMVIDNMKIIGMNSSDVGIMMMASGSTGQQAILKVKNSIIPSSKFYGAFGVFINTELGELPFVDTYNPTTVKTINCYDSSYSPVQ